MKIYLDNANIGELEKKYVLDALESGFISTRGPLIKVFEEKFGSYLKGYISATYSGTAALHLSILYSIKKYDIKGRKIGGILPAITFAATSHALLYNSIIPIFVDVDPYSWNIDPEKIPDLIEIAKRNGIDTKFIVPVHLYGNPADMDKIMNIAKIYDLVVIEDAAEALNSIYQGKFCGTIGNFGAFSFNANKVITASSGGAVFSKNQEDIEYIRFLTLQARNETKGYYHEDLGFNYRMTNIEAAIILAQLEKLDYFCKLKKEFFRIYSFYLSDRVEFQKVPENSQHNYWLISCKFNNIKVEDLIQKISNFGIPTRKVFYPLPLMDFYRQYVEKYLANYKLTDFYKNSLEIYEKSLCLPSSTKNSMDVIEFVSKKILEVI